MCVELREARLWAPDPARSRVAAVRHSSHERPVSTLTAPECVQHCCCCWLLLLLPLLTLVGNFLAS
jgi:hypothetical protein